MHGLSVQEQSHQNLPYYTVYRHVITLYRTEYVELEAKIVGQCYNQSLHIRMDWWHYVLTCCSGLQVFNSWMRNAWVILESPSMACKVSLLVWVHWGQLSSALINNHAVPTITMIQVKSLLSAGHFNVWYVHFLAILTEISKKMSCYRIQLSINNTNIAN